MATIYSSTDAGAPTLGTTAGGLLNILDACLVGTTGIAYGSVPSMGWTLEYSATNQRSYRMPTAGSSGFYLSVTDTSTGSYAAVNFRGYETMTSVSGGTNPFPTVAQMANGVFYDKGVTASNSKTWHLWSNGTLFHLLIDASNALYTSDIMLSGRLFTFGDIESNYPSDVYNCAIAGYTAAGSTIAYPIASSPSATSAASYLARGYDGVSLSVAMAKCPIQSLYKYMAHDTMVYNGVLSFSKMVILDLPASGRIFRGFMPGLYFQNHYPGYVKFGIPIEAVSGKSFNCFNMYNNEYLALLNSEGV